MSKPQIYDMASLDAEIKRLKRRSKELEERMEDSADELKENYGNMAFNSFIGNRIKNIPILGAILYPWVIDESVQETIQQFSERFFKKSGEYLQKLLSAIFDK